MKKGPIVHPFWVEWKIVKKNERDWEELNKGGESTIPLEEIHQSVDL